MSYYDNQASGHFVPSNPPPQPQASTWDRQTPPARSGASSAIPREEPQAFAYQIEEVERAIDNLVKSGKMFNMGGRLVGRVPPPSGPRPHSMAEFGAGDARLHNPQSNLQSFYASQRHQSSRGSNEAESMMQAKRRMAAQRERDLRNYHQEQQFNRTVLSDAPSYAGKTTRTLSPGSTTSGGMTEEERRDLIARQRSALYGEGPFAESGGYVDETGATRPGIPGPQGPQGPVGGQGPAGLRGASPLTYDFSRAPHGDAASGHQPAELGQRSRANSTSSPQSNTPSQKGVFETAQAAQQPNRTSNSSPGEPSHYQHGQGAPIGTKPGQPAATVAPIGTRPGAGPASTQSATNPALNKRSSPPVSSPLSRVPASGGDGAPPSAGATSNPPSATPEGSVGMSGWGNRSGVWGNKSGLQASASAWG